MTRLALAVIIAVLAPAAPALAQSKAKSCDAEAARIVRPTKNMACQRNPEACRAQYRQAYEACLRR